MKVLILETAEAAVARTANVISEAVKRKPDAVLGLATGGTMLPLYVELTRLFNTGEISFAKVRSFNLDEYVGLSPCHPESYHAYMRNSLFDQIDIDNANTYLPKGDAKDPVQEARDYESRIEKVGGIDLQLLGIGQNGHIGFNEPTSSLASKTRIKTLTKSTREANYIYFAGDNEAPKFALTMGIGTILAARACILLAIGESKARAVADAVEGPVSAACPASALQMHERATLIVDRAAAAELTLTEYYEYVHPEGKDSDFD